ncbi:PilC/PilY family type IV pilus protein [Pseudoalteromonas carrageenovora]|uniref:PilC/PilY family type IV pilus protein n=1 Tax=Pseudoalteromonas carrageenovora TaxID=227 RepID=UPI0021175EF6|nr:PilC/PilY family type IV pilus protein [Pseudoalteromonas carrageenovora]MCQ8889029.1 PilC/PilY family type IV pilus protein [Pseudoalteromonas carrageenovora]MDO6547913.1 PilC/PilY family type IV pilus protein [Pseudoalteromonas carrageenovora]MDO6832220.1 PilC/PilY family type IV pilus protein [Pseudoalteromonas carrageenovora]
MKLNKILASLISLTLSASAFAEDIELYVNHDVDVEEKPRVLLIFDTSGSMAFSSSNGDNCGYNNFLGLYNLCVDSRLAAAQFAMNKVVSDNEDTIDFGLMRFKSTTGGYIVNGVGSDSSVVRNSIAALPADGGTPLTETLWEAYLYITGQGVQYGLEATTLERDTSAELRTGSQYTEVECDWVWKGRRSGWVYECENVVKDNYQYTYISPFEDSDAEAIRCDNSINIIYMTDGDPSGDNDSDSQISAEHEKYFGEGLNWNTDSYYSSYLHQMAKIIHGTSDVTVDLYPSTPDIHETGRLYTIGFGSGMSASGQELLRRAASLGGGENLPASTPDELSNSLNSAISRIREVNDSFSSPSVASNNVDQTRSRDAIYFAMFYPETNTRWGGNLKKLKVSGSEIVDSADNTALDSDGLIDTDAKTFWLPDGQSADGNLVAQGGVNYHLATLTGTPAEDRRNLYTDKQGDIVDFTTNIVSDILDLVTNNPISLSSSDIEWAMGIDVDDEDNDGSNTDQRSDIFGDPLHSKPVAIDYGNDDIRILIGTNAGFLHMFKDDDTNNEVSESWAFIPSDLYDIIQPLRNEDTGKVYGMDGPISVYFSDKSLNDEGVNDGIVDASDGDDVWAFAGMRRGGRNYYALDITNPNEPKKLWDNPIEGGKGDFTELAQTWSKPQIAYIKAFGDKPLLVFGAGYDTNKDAVVRSEDSVGRGIYIVEAETGKKVWALTPSENGFKGKHSIAANVSTLDSDYDGYIDRIYAADTGGDIWRIDMPGSSTSNFTHFKLAELGSSLASQDRRFFYQPLVARTLYSKVSETTINGETVITRLDTPYDAIVIGSGNRSKPTGINEDDQLFMIRDENTVTKSFTTSPTAIKPTDLMQMNSDPFGNALDDVDEFVDLEVDLAKFKGWRYELGSGEKSLAAATVVGGVAYFTSFTPSSDTSTENQCSLSGGGGSLYAFHLHYGTKVYDDLKFTTSYDVPDTPQLYFGEGPSCADGNGDGMCDDNPTIEVTQESQFYLIGPGIKGEDAQNPMKPVEVVGPGLTVVDGTIQLVNDSDTVGFGFKTQQTYIFKREENDEVGN